MRPGWSLILFAVLLAAGLAAPAQTITERARRDQIVLVPDDDPDMSTAFVKARATLAEFLALARAPRPGMSMFSVKVPLQEGDTVEYFWVNGFAGEDGHFTGSIDNAPRLLKQVRDGQAVTFSEREIVDWMYLEDGRMFGNFTGCALLKREDPTEAETFKSQFGLHCQD